MRIILLLLTIIISTFSVFAQNQYECEILQNPTSGKKDSREVNAVIIFEKDKLIVKSRRKNKVFKEFAYSDIKKIEHSFYPQKSPFKSEVSEAIFTVFTGIPSNWLSKKESHWFSLQTENDFVILKVENDNYRLIKVEFEVKKFEIIYLVDDKPIKK